MPNFQNILTSLFDIIVTLYLLALILRFWLQIFRADFYNPIVQFIVLYTDGPIGFLQRILPKLRGIDLATIILMLVFGFLKIMVPITMRGYPIHWGSALIGGIAYILNAMVWMFLLAILARVVLSWVAPQTRHPFARIVLLLSEPILAPFRRILPTFGGLDFSPIIALLALQMLQNVVIAPLTIWLSRLL